VPPVAVTVTEAVTMVAPVSVLLTEDGATVAVSEPGIESAAAATPLVAGWVLEVLPASVLTRTQ
jgi:hypothetical protein